MAHSIHFKCKHGIYAPILFITCLLFLAPVAAQSTPKAQSKLYFFTQSGCAPCQQMKPTIEWISQYIDVQTIDTQHQQQWARHFNVRRTPTVVIATGNKVVARREGAISRTDLATFWNHYASASADQGSQSTTTSAKSNVAHNYSARHASFESPHRPASTSSSAKQNAHRSTVRLKIDEGGAVSYATGTVIHIQNNEALVITCGHAFRENRGQGAITGQSGFADGRPTNISGNLLFYDAGANDVALVVVKPATGLIAAEIADPKYNAERGEQFFSFGCNHGDDPSILECNFLRLGQYSSPGEKTSAIRYDTTKRPVQGRSGGGLFNASGQLIGICTGAAVEVDEGIYGSINVIYRGIEKAGLTQLFTKHANQDRVVFKNQLRSSNQQLNQVPNRTGNNSATRITPVVNRSQLNNVEIQCSVRTGSGPNDVQQIFIKNPSQELISLLNSEGHLINQAARTANQNGEVIRAQSHR